MTRETRWFLGLASIPIVLILVLLMWMNGWFYPKPAELRVIEDSFEPYVVESGVLVETTYRDGFGVLGTTDPFAVFYYEPVEGYSMWELSEELREAAMSDGWFAAGVTDERDEDSDTTYANCAWYGNDRVLGGALRFEYSIRATHECHEDTIIRLSVRYEGEID